MRDLPALPPGCPLHLGEPQAIYRQGNVCRLRYAARLAVWLTVVLGFAWLYGYFILDRPTPRTLAVGLGAWLVVAALPTFFLFRKARVCLTQLHDVAILCPDGFAYFHDNVWRSFRWDEITEVTAWVKGPSWDWSGGDAASAALTPVLAFLQGYSCRYEVAAPGAETVHIGQTLTNSDDLIGKIQGKTFQTRLGRATRAFDDGDEVHFGPLVMQRARGIGYGGRWYPWEKVGYLSYPDEKDSPLKVTPVQGHWFESMSVPWREIANADLVHSVSAHGLKLAGRYKSLFAPAAR